MSFGSEGAFAYADGYKNGKKQMPDPWAEGEKVGFLRGAAFVLGLCNEREPFIAERIVDNLGYTWDQFVDADVDHIDLERIRSLFDEEE